MKSKLLAFTLFASTAAVVFAYPTYKDSNNLPTNTPVNSIPIPHVTPANAPRVEVVFVLDTTGSMGGLIQAAKEKIWSIASNMASAQSAPEVKIGLVAFRDRGDTYVTKSIDLSSDLDSMYAKLMDFQANGGGDHPESVNQGLHDAVHKMSWSLQDKNTYKVIFLVGDAPAHMDYQDDIKYPQTINLASSKGIVVNTIQCGNDHNTKNNWQQIASLSNGDFFQVTQSGNAVAISTPFDKKLAKLSEELDETRLFYGDAKVKAEKKRKVDATRKLHAKSSDESRARRAAFNASKSGKANFLGDSELVDDVVSGKVDISKIAPSQLPATIQALPLNKRNEEIKKTAQKREVLQRQIRQIAEQRSDYMKKKIKEKGGAKDSLDAKIYSSIRKQAKEKGLMYEAEAASY